MVSFRMPGAPFTSWLTLGFLLVVLVLLGFDYPNGTYTVLSIPLVAGALMLGWAKAVRSKAKGSEEIESDPSHVGALLNRDERSFYSVLSSLELNCCLKAANMHSLKTLGKLYEYAFRPFNHRRVIAAHQRLRCI
ncbi:hypothetical protein D3C81_1431850 [compost metagenome]